jgi:hypothetical protein
MLTISQGAFETSGLFSLKSSMIVLLQIPSNCSGPTLGYAASKIFALKAPAYIFVAAELCCPDSFVTI